MRLLLVCLMILGLPVFQCRAGDEAGLKGAVKLGVAWLVMQQKADGSFSDGGPYPAAKTALVMLALHDAGHHASDASTEGRALLKSAVFLSTISGQEGCYHLKGAYVANEDRSRMYGHALITCALATVTEEIADHALRDKVRSRVQQAADFILASQGVKKLATDDGGWRYEGISMDSDISSTVLQLRALRAAADHAGAKVPDEAWQKAAAYVKRLSRSMGKQPDETRAMSYQFTDSRADLSTTGMGVHALQCCALPHAFEADAGRVFIDRQEPRDYKGGFPFWAMSHCSHAMLEGSGEQKARFVGRMARLLLPKQKPEGSWRSDKAAEKQSGDIYATALVISALGPWTPGD